MAMAMDIKSIDSDLKVKLAMSNATSTHARIAAIVLMCNSATSLRVDTYSFSSSINLFVVWFCYDLATLLTF
jgi:hypothetical protein